MSKSLLVDAALAVLPCVSGRSNVINKGLQAASVIGLFCLSSPFQEGSVECWTFGSYYSWNAAVGGGFCNEK
jgi:hypothetical protein